MVESNNFHLLQKPKLNLKKTLSWKRSKVCQGEKASKFKYLNMHEQNKIKQLICCKICGSILISHLWNVILLSSSSATMALWSILDFRWITVTYKAETKTKNLHQSIKFYSKEYTFQGIYICIWILLQKMRSIHICIQIHWKCVHIHEYFYEYFWNFTLWYIYYNSID